MIYCGNNANHQPLVNGEARLGTRFECLQKGKQIGLSRPIDPLFAQPYQPIDPLRKYCGNQENVPNGYNRFGTLHECLLTGIGVGKRLRAQGENIPNNIQNIHHQQNVPNIENIQSGLTYKSKILLSGIIFTVLFVSLFTGLYFGKPSFLTKYDEKQKQNIIVWTIFIPYLLSFALILFIFLYIIFFKFL